MKIVGFLSSLLVIKTFGFFFLGPRILENKNTFILRRPTFEFFKHDNISMILPIFIKKEYLVGNEFIFYFH